MPKFTPDPSTLPVIRQLFLLEFTPLEMMESVSQAAGRPVAIADIEDHIAYLHEGWGTTPESESVNISEGTLWARSEMFRHDLLGLYADQLQNARATMQGDFNHPDGRPVIKTKPAEVVSTAEKILAFERATINEQRQAMLRLGAAASGVTPPQAETPRFNASDESEEDWSIEPPTRTEL